MQIEKSSQGDLLELTVEGRLDNDSSVYFREEIEAAARLAGVDRLASVRLATLEADGKISIIRR